MSPVWPSYRSECHHYISHFSSHFSANVWHPKFDTKAFSQFETDLETKCIESLHLFKVLAKTFMCHWKCLGVSRIIGCLTNSAVIGRFVLWIQFVQRAVMFVGGRRWKQRLKGYQGRTRSHHRRRRRGRGRDRRHTPRSTNIRDTEVRLRSSSSQINSPIN